MEDRIREESIIEKRSPGRPPKNKVSEEPIKAEPKTDTPKLKYPPFTTKEELPEPVLDKNKKFKAVTGYRYYVQTMPNRKYKLLAMYKKPTGIFKKLVAVLTPFGKNKEGSRSRTILNQLKESGVQGIYGY